MKKKTAIQSSPSISKYFLGDICNLFPLNIGLKPEAIQLRAQIRAIRFNLFQTAKKDFHYYLYRKLPSIAVVPTNRKEYTVNKKFPVAFERISQRNLKKIPLLQIQRNIHC